MNVFHEFSEGAGQFLPKLPGMLITFVIGAVLIRLVLWLVRSGLKVARLPQGLSGIIGSLAAVLSWVTLIVVIFVSYGFDRFALYLSGSTAIILFVLGAGASQLIADIISGLALSSDHHFRVGAWVRAGDRSTEGRIISMDMRKTRIEDQKGLLHVIPNGVIEKNEWVLLSRGQAKKRSSGAKSSLKS